MIFLSVLYCHNPLGSLSSYRSKGSMVGQSKKKYYCHIKQYDQNDVQNLTTAMKWRSQTSLSHRTSNIHEIRPLYFIYLYIST